ncbi:MAG: WD40/YVTN/BNR-like repeat-containing protein, partial [Candidatus Aminicenantaceae bacterium]
LYHCAQVVFKSTNEGQSWQVISPDLTTNDKSKQQKSGGPITKDDTSVEYYCTIFALAESQFNPEILWAGTDDGLVYITRNGGRTWDNITPEQLPEWSMISMIDTSTFAPGRAYIAVDRHRLDDFAPYIYKTEDFGKSWMKITNGIPDGAFVRVVREDPERKGLLYAGTETGVYVSFDDGRNWQSLQLNLPVVPIRDMVVKEDDLVAATHGRSFWILDDLTPLHQLNPEVAALDFFLFKPRYAYRMKGGSYPRENVGQNPPSGSVITYFLKEKPQQPITLEFRDDRGRLIKTHTASAESGMNRFVWNMRYPDAKRVPGAVLWGGSGQGPVAPPGKYEVRLMVGENTQIQSWEWRKDPRIDATQADLQRQFDFLIEIRDKLTEVNEGIITLRSMRAQIQDVLEKVKGRKNVDDLIEFGRKLTGKLTAIEDVLIQSKSQSPQDPLNYPIKLDNKLAALMPVVASADARPTQQSYQVFRELSSRAETQLGQLDLLKRRDLPEFNEMVKRAGVPAVLIK